MQLAAGLILVIVSSALVSLVPRLLQIALDRIRNGAPLPGVWTIAAAMIGVTIVAGSMRFGMRMYLNRVSRWMEFDLRNDLFRKLETLDQGYFSRVRTGDLMARLTNDLSAVRMAIGPAVMYLASTIFGGIFALYFMLRIDARLTAIALLPMICMPAVAIVLGRRIHDRFDAVQENFSRLTALTQENLAGVRIVRAFRQEEAEIQRFGALNDEYVERNMALARLYGVMQPSFGIFAGGGMVAVLGIGGLLTLRGGISVGSFVAFGMYLGMLTWPMIALGWVTNLFQRGAASMARLVEILDARATIVTPASPRVLAPARSGRTIEFRGVGFRYGGDEAGTRWVLRDISFVAPAGSTIGIVGATGSGKSALMDLVARLHDPQEGEILIDGIPLRDVGLDQLRREIGYVPQESFLFSDTIRSNLEYGGASAADAEWAAGVAQLTETIRDFAGGFDTMLGERGINLSGGQKQRVALARALARRPGIVLLDDALSAVDTHTEAEILRALRETLEGRTALIASHRVSAIRDATWIIVLDEGRVVEQGRHDALLAAGGRYWSLLNRQQLEASVELGGELAETGPPGTLR
ncbi:MAG TPA: ABC transporter ATP-binding protein [Gemmatimonadaceae bacterium]|nr:ABC transporter ATP-binding protein [Gemmatimonadaceae bacterium]